MARTRSTAPQYEPTQASKALKLRRVELGKSQADVAFDSEVLTQTTVSELERGKYGPGDLTSTRLAALAKGLNWTVAELEKATGANLGLTIMHFYSVKVEDIRNHVGDAPYPTTSSSQGAAPFSADALGYQIPRREPEPIGDALLEAANLYGDSPEFAPLREYRWQRHLWDTPYRKRPQTPSEWLTAFIALKDMVDPPEPDA